MKMEAIYILLFTGHSRCQKKYNQFTVWHVPVKSAIYFDLNSFIGCRSAGQLVGFQPSEPDSHASMLLLCEGSEATEPYNKCGNLFKYIS